MTQVLEDAIAVAEHAAHFIDDFVKAKPTANVLVATGHTPIPTYEALTCLRPDMSLTTAIQLDEYLIPEGDARSLYGWMGRAYITPLGVKDVLRFDLAEKDAERMCREYAQTVRELGGIDLAILGLGSNGHLGFNEPPSGPDAPTRVVELTPASLASNAAYWEGAPVPSRAVTVGMDLILAAHTTLLLVTGEHKRDILRRTLYGPISPNVPASYLQNTNLSVITDQAVELESLDD